MVNLRSASWIVLAIGLVSSASTFAAEAAPPGPGFYRQFALSVRTQGTFRVLMPNGTEMEFSYALKASRPKFTEPVLSDFSLSPGNPSFVRNFLDKIYLEDGSNITIGAEKIPLTCIFLHGEDNRFTSKDSPLIPDFVLRVYLVANDYTCTGPINPSWPVNGGKKETWDTYFYFEVRDPTIMLPTESRLRYRWNEFQAVVIDSGRVSP